MFAVGRLGSYISRGVYTVSGPFHPFGGAVDIIVVEQPDGSFKSSPWYVRFGKFQGVLKATEKVVCINVNGVDAVFHMYLDSKGEAFFVREADASQGDFEPYPSSGDEVDPNPDVWRNQKSKSYSFDANRTDLISELESNNVKVKARSSPRRGRVFYFSFGRKSTKENSFRNGEGDYGVDRASSLERAEIAADLLEVRWTTNLATGKNSPRSFNQKQPIVEIISNVGTDDAPVVKETILNGHKENKLETIVSCVDNVSSGAADSQTDVEASYSTNPSNFVEIFTDKEIDLGDDIVNKDRNVPRSYSEITASVLKISSTMDVRQCVDNSSSGNVSQKNDITEIGSGTDKVDSSVSCDAKVDSVALSQNSGSKNDGSIKIVVDPLQEPEGQSSVISSEPVLSFPMSEMDREADRLENVDSGNQHEETFSVSADALLVVKADRKCSFDDLGGRCLSLGAEDTQEKVASPSSEISEEEQFSFSDLDGPKMERRERGEESSQDSGKNGLSREPSRSSEEELTETITKNELHQVTGKLIQDEPPIVQSPKTSSSELSSPIAISRVRIEADEQFFGPAVESLPNLLFTSESLHPHGVALPLSRSFDSNFDPPKIINEDVQSCLESGAKQLQGAQLKTTSNITQISEEIKNIISDPAVEVSLCRHLCCEGMGYEAAATAFDAERLDLDKFCSLGPDIVKNDNLVVRIGGLYFPWDAAVPIASAIGSLGNEQILEPKGMIAVGQVDKSSEGTPPKSVNSRIGSWRIWPFSFRRSNSMKSVAPEPASETPMENDRSTAVAETKVKKKKIRVKAPTSEQLASLHLKEGKNVVTFTFSTAMLGNQQIDARIFLWKWNTRIVISDVDGTITKSDVLGQFLPLMGMDWSQTGVTHLFSAIKENGYQLLFLSARSISQAYHTRQFLVNLKQDGKALPEGPIVISPDGLFPSLYREVIRRAPHEFKIACLEDIKALFPVDHSPFYAGFGNRDTDELSYLKVGIPKGKIFTINPKGEVAVNRRVDTKSYTSLHALVHGMFPPTPVHEQEDYNQWNFWRLPPPDVGF